MSLLVAAPECLAAAAADLQYIGSGLRSANIAAAFPTSGLLAAGADEVSTAIASLFSGQALTYRAVSAQAAIFHPQFVQALTAGAGAYAAAEAASASPLQGLVDAINAPVLAATGRPLIGNGADATTPGGNGGDGGIL